MAYYRDEANKRRPKYSRISAEDADRLALEAASLVPTRPRFAKGSFAAFVYETYVPSVYPGIRLTSRHKYDGLFRNHILPILGHLQLAEIGLEEMNKLRDSVKRTDRRKTDVSNAQRREVVLRAKEVLKLAHALGKVKRADWSLVKAPRKPKRKIRPEPEHNLTELLLGAASGTFMEGPIFAALFLGLRRGEVCGLKWSAIDRDRQTILIDKQRQLRKFGGENDTKSDERRFEVPKSLIDWLDARATHPIYVFTSSGKPINVNKVTEAMPDLCKKAGIRTVTFHDLRSFAASNLAALGAAPVTIMEILGHQDLSTTLIYLNATAKARRSAITKLVESHLRQQRVASK